MKIIPYINHFILFLHLVDVIFFLLFIEHFSLINIHFVSKLLSANFIGF